MKDAEGGVTCQTTHNTAHSTHRSGKIDFFDNPDRRSHWRGQLRRVHQPTAEEQP